MYYLEIILPLAFGGETFTYSFSSSRVQSEQLPELGARVSVPLKNSTQVGIVVEVHQRKIHGISIKEVGSVLDSTPIFTPSQIQLLRWLSSYYMTPVGQVFKHFLPTSIRTGTYKVPTQKAYKLAVDGDLKETYEKLNKRKAATAALNKFLGMLDLFNENRTLTHRELSANGTSPTGLKQLIAHGVLQDVELPRKRYQKRVAQSLAHYGEDEKSICEGITQAQNTVLLYNRDNELLEKVIARKIALCSSEGKLSLILMPDSFSASSLAERLSERFQVVEHHSEISQSKRNQNYFRLLEHSHSVDVVVGTRTSLMLPLENLGLIVVMAENDYGHKENQRDPRFNARDVSLKVAQLSGSQIILTTPAPSLEAFWRCYQGHWTKINIGTPSKVEIKLLEKGKSQIFSKYMLARIGESLDVGKRVIILQNRRGYGGAMVCGDCGYTFYCPRCNVSLSVHRSNNTLRCHHCSHTQPILEQCPSCLEHNLSSQGMGTERVSEELSSVFPHALITRVDSDTLPKKAGQKIQGDIIVGTQLALRALQNERFALGVVVNADNLFLSIDFRTSERAVASLLALRGMIEPSGEMIMQSWNTQNPVLKAIEWNLVTELFYIPELKERIALRYPPIARLVVLRLRAKSRAQLFNAAMELDSVLSSTLGSKTSPPYEPAIDRTHDHFLLEIMLRLDRDQSLRDNKNFIYQTIKDFRQRHSNVTVVVDVDPL